MLMVCSVILRFKQSYAELSFGIYHNVWLTYGNNLRTISHLEVGKE